MDDESFKTACANYMDYVLKPKHQHMNLNILYREIQDWCYDTVSSRMKSKKQKRGESNIDYYYRLITEPSTTYIETKRKMDERNNIKFNAVYDDKIVCDNCGKKKVMVSVIQLRSSDEDISTVHKCAECGYRWIT